MKPRLDAYLQQGSREEAPYPLTCRRLTELSLEAGLLLERRPMAPGAPS
jgi:hypothetical protein